MNRKNTLILAILVNAGIFLLLFIAVNQGHQDDQLKVPSEEPAGERKSAQRLPDGKDGPLTRRPAADPLRVLQDARAGDEQESEQYLEITARRGDQLDRLALGYGTTADEILRLNRLTSVQLSPGQILKIPLARETDQPMFEGANDGVGSPVRETAPASKEEEIFYIVKKGDSPWTIAQRHKIKLEELLRINDLDEKKARRLREGDRLKVS